jgi:EpsD family peptidyl-prolyl cis-trans isomerase
VIRFRWTVFTIALVLLTACSRHPSPATRAAVKVNGTEISVQRVQMLRSRVGPQLAEKPLALVESLIDRELLMQNAVALKVDQDLRVAIALAEAKEDILAQAYLEKLVGSSAEDQGAVAGFYYENPALFKERRIYRVFELSVSASPDRVAALKERAERAQGLHEVAAWLKKQNVPFNAGGVTKASEQLAPELLSRLASMEEGRIAVMEWPGGASVLQLLQSGPAPLSRDEAAPMIEQLLRARRRAEVLERERKYLRGKASIEYVIDLGQPRSAQQAEPLPPAYSLPVFLL